MKRRDLIKKIGVSSGVAWTAPVISSVVLPAHAQTSSMCSLSIEISPTQGPIIPPGGFGVSLSTDSALTVQANFQQIRILSSGGSETIEQSVTLVNGVALTIDFAVVDTNITRYKFNLTSDLCGNASAAIDIV